ncbi:hypothetical protein FACS1894160_3810 [Bacteroidia bacterium]|nr:hypothetical protein FACS1894160_3810 [Bacteroidia bacterium]
MASGNGSDKKDNKKQQTEAVLIDGIAIDTQVHDFGTIREDGGDVSTTFKFTNKTKNPILITEARASCGCTTSSYTKEPIGPKKSGEVTAKFTAKGHPGPFTKTITVTIAGVQNPIVLRIKGVVE